METKRGDCNPVHASAPLDNSQRNACSICSQQQYCSAGMPHGGQGQYYPHQEPNHPPILPCAPPIYTISYPQPSDVFYPPGPPPPYFLTPDMPSPPPYFPGTAAHPIHLPDPRPTPVPPSHAPEPRRPRAIYRRRVRLIVALVDPECQARITFLRKVYLFHLLQMVILNVFLYLSIYSGSVRTYFQQDYTYTIVAIVAEFILVTMLLSSTKLRKVTPVNYILLLCCSVVLSFLVAISAASTNGREVLLATAIHIITACVLLISAGMKMAFRTWGAIMIAIIPVIAGCVTYHYEYPNKLNHIVIIGTGAMIMSLYICADMLQILRGTHKYFPPSDEALCLCTMLLQKLVFGFCFIMCVFFVFF